MPRVEASVKKSSQYALRIVDIKKWGTPVTEQFGIRSIPHFLLFDPSGKQIDQGFQGIYQKVVDPSVDPAKPSSSRAGLRRFLAIGMAVVGLLMVMGKD
jgi:thioredoxin-like negative regulator of GroEL